MEVIENGIEEKFHLGHRIRTVFESNQMSVSEFARQIHCERTNVYTIFNRRTIDTDLLARICKVLEYNFFGDVMKEYGLTEMFSPKLDIHIDLGDCSHEKVDGLLHSISHVIEDNTDLDRE